MQEILYFIKKYIKDIALFSLIAICLSISLYSFYNGDETEIESINEIAITDVNDDENLEYVQNKTINIDVKGAVKNPGVYQVEDGTIINEIITLAGGFKSNAYKNGINLSKKVSDEMVIYVYTKTEINEKKDVVTDTVTSTIKTCNTTDYSICECIDDKVSIIETENIVVSNTSDSGNTENGNASESTLVNINTANESELTTLSGIGTSKAEAIISYRKENGNFLNIADIMNVSGIGEALFAKIKDFITI